VSQVHSGSWLTTYPTTPGRWGRSVGQVLRRAVLRPRRRAGVRIRSRM
jgi:hypothetical protein